MTRKKAYMKPVMWVVAFQQRQHLLSISGGIFRFTVTNASGTYSGTAKATLVEGEYVVATGLKLTKQ